MAELVGVLNLLSKLEKIIVTSKKHTSGPWRVGVNSDFILDSGSQFICRLNLVDTFHANSEPVIKPKEANAERIVACVNACEGIEDPSVVPELLFYVKAMHRHLSERSKLRMADKDLAEVRKLLARAEGSK